MLKAGDLKTILSYSLGSPISLFNKIYLVVPYIFSNFAHRNLGVVQELIKKD